MIPPEFRRDPYLRTCGYDLLVWAPLNALLSFPAAMALVARPLPASVSGFLLATTIAFGIVMMWTNRRRAAKLMGPTDCRPSHRRFSVSGATIWLAALAFGAVLNWIPGVGCRCMLLPIWMLTIGCGCVFRGRRRVPELSIFGMSAALAGLASVGLQSFSGMAATSAGTLIVWNATMVVAAGITAVIINRRYVWRAI